MSRPVGSKNIHSKDAVRKLAQLGFDPIEKMVQMYQRVVDDIAAEKAKQKPSAMLLASLINVEQKCINDLMRYGYSRVSETNVIEQRELPPLSIVMTPAGYKPGDPLPDEIDGVKITNGPDEDDFKELDYSKERMLNEANEANETE
jgi:hypothetical protein